MSTPETKSASSDVSEPTVDVEHMPVADDPRKWSNARKVNFFQCYFLASLTLDLEFRLVTSRFWVGDSWSRR